MWAKYLEPEFQEFSPSAQMKVKGEEITEKVSSGCSWLPYWLWRLDEEYENLYWEVKHNVKIKPSEYFRRQCFISIEPSEPLLTGVIEYIGSDNLIFGSDYPHMDHNPKIIQELVKLEETLSKETLQKILWDNPCRFYGLF